MKPKRKKIVKLGWGVKWHSGRIDFFRTKKIALTVIEWSTTPSILFRCKIEEITK